MPEIYAVFLHVKNNAPLHLEKCAIDVMKYSNYSIFVSTGPA